MTKQERQEFILYVTNLYDEYLQLTEKRGISYGEIAYIQGLNKKELLALESEINYFKYLDKSKEYFELKYE